MRIALLILALIFGSCAGFLGYTTTELGWRIRTPKDLPSRPTPYPHFAPKYAGGVSLRFAMVHDVIHERYPVRGPAYYRERDRIVREKLKTIPPDSQQAFDLTDDLGVGLDKLGRAGEAVQPLRDKLARQLKAGQGGRQIYTSYANLGTFLIHANMKAAMGGDAKAKANVKEGLVFIQQSINVNPEAHFGREEWQLHIGEFLLAAIDDPILLTRYDCVGNDLASEPAVDGQNLISSAIDRSNFVGFGGEKLADQFDERGELRKPTMREAIRLAIRNVGADPDFPETVLKYSVPFDEPTLGIIGMWRQGGGANPYFAVALGEIMLRVGQRYIAWTAYERAHMLADRYGWKPEHAAFLREHCHHRQENIEKELKLSAESLINLRQRFKAELAYGQRYQKEYHEYEAKQIAAGANIFDEHFYDDFHKGREPIATPLGPAEWFDGTDPDQIPPLRDRTARSTAVLWFGIAAFAVVVIGRLFLFLQNRSAPRARLSVSELPPSPPGA
jgi:hypothetical protein